MRLYEQDPINELYTTAAILLNKHTSRSRRSSKQVGASFRLGSKYPTINWTLIDGTFNRTFSFRRDADAVVNHGYFEPIPEDAKTELPPSPVWSNKFDFYNQNNFNIGHNKKQGAVHLLRNHILEGSVP